MSGVEGSVGGSRPYGASRKRVPAFARYRGTSAWRKDRRRVRAYARYLEGKDGAGKDGGRR